MEIHWGNFYFQCERTVAVLIAAGPLIAIMSLPQFAKIIRRVTIWAKKRKEVERKRLYGNG